MDSSTSSNIETHQKSLVEEVSISPDEELLHQEPDTFKGGLSEAWSIHPASVAVESLGRRSMDTLRAIPEDIKQSGHKARTVGAFALGASTFVADKLRYGFTYFVAQPAVSELRNSQSIPKTALVAMGGFMLWNTFANESFNTMISAFDKTKKAFVKNFPLVIKLFEEILPGVHRPDDPKVNPDQKLGVGQKIRNIPKNAWLNLRRLGVGLGTGSAAFVGLTRAQEYSYLEGTKQDVKVGLSTAVGVGAIAAILSKVIIEIQDEHPELVKDIMDVVENSKTWLAVGVGFMGLQYFLNRRKKQQIIMQDTGAEAETAYQASD